MVPLLSEFLAERPTPTTRQVSSGGPPPQLPRDPGQPRRHAPWRSGGASIDAKRARNKRFANRLITTVGRAGRRHSIFAVIHFAGRRSGTPYNTPIRLVEQGDDCIVPLTYGPRTSWYLNLLANPGELQWQGQTIPVVGNPTLIPTSTVGAPLLPPPSRFLIWLDGTDTCVRLKRVLAPGSAGPEELN